MNDEKDMKEKQNRQENEKIKGDTYIAQSLREREREALRILKVL